MPRPVRSQSAASKSWTRDQSTDCGPAGDHSRIANHVLAPSPGVYAIDAVYTFVGFTAQHRVVGRVRGRLESVAGTVTIAED